MRNQLPIVLKVEGGYLHYCITCSVKTEKVPKDEFHILKDTEQNRKAWAAQDLSLAEEAKEESL